MAAEQRLEYMQNMTHRRVEVLEDMLRQDGQEMIMSAGNRDAEKRVIAHFVKTHRQLEDVRLIQRALLIAAGDSPTPILELSEGAEINYGVDGRVGETKTGNDFIEGQSQEEAEGEILEEFNSRRDFPSEGPYASPPPQTDAQGNIIYNQGREVRFDQRGN